MDDARRVEPLHNIVTGDSAYVVVPATMKFQSGRQADYAIWRGLYGDASRKLAERWRIAAWAWAKGTTRTLEYLP